MKNLFNSIKVQKPNSNVFDLTHDVKLSCNMGNLVPIMCMEAVPGDKFNIGCESLLRFAPLVSPVMHRMDVTMHYFFVPNRIIWPNWEKFIVGEDVEFPFLAIEEPVYTPLCDYLGIPRPVGVGVENISALPFAAYQKIYNEYYRDQNLITEIDSELVDGSNDGNLELTVLRKRAWEHDYFTAALPFAQKGAAVSIPLGDVTLKEPWQTIDGDPKNPRFKRDSDNAMVAGALSQSTTPAPGIYGAGDAANRLAYDPDGTLEVGATTINDLRRAWKLQEWLEKNARAGTRYIENILAHFGVRSSDKRLQRPEYITGTKSPVQISEVLNTTGTTDAPQGNMAGHGISVTSGKYGNYFCEEHGYIIGVMSVMPKPAYVNMLPKHFIKTDPLEFFWPSFAHIGEQPVLNKEIYAFQPGVAGDQTFGYVPRYAEYKFEPSRVAGDFRTNLDFWHLGRKFAAAPALNQAFIEVDSETTDRIFAVTDPDVQKLYVHVLNRVTAVRRMPKFGTPSF